MILSKLHYELQCNPRNLVVYRKIMEYYKSTGDTNEFRAFEELIRRKFVNNGSNYNEKQPIDDNEHT